MKILETTLDDITKDKFLRIDVDYFIIKNNLNLDNTYKLKNYITFLETGKSIERQDYSKTDGDYLHVIVKNIVDGELNIDGAIAITDKKGEELKHYRLQKYDFVIAISSNCGHCFYYDAEMSQNLTLSHYLARFKVSDKINPYFLLYYINSSIIKSYYKSIETGKTLKNLSKHYIKEMPILITNKEKQDEIVATIKPIEKEIKQFKSTLLDEHAVINEVFAKEFNFDVNLRHELGKGMTAGTQRLQDRQLRVFNVDFANFGKSKTLRFSSRYHNPITQSLMAILANMPTKRVKNIVTQFVKGVQPEYEIDGEISVVKIANLGNNNINLTDSEKVSQEYYDNIDNSKKLRQNDIIICATGKVSLGKIDLFELDEDAITSVDNIIIRINEEAYLPLFFIYYFRSVLGYFQIERDFTGTTNQIHLYESSIQEFLIPDIPLKRQKEIIEQIKHVLEANKITQDKITKKRDEIDKIIETYIVNQ